MASTHRVAFLAVLMLTLVGALPSAAQSRGSARISGKVADDQGQPAAAVEVRAIKQGERQPLQTKTDAKGEWSISGLAGGAWNLELVKAGFEPTRLSLEVTESEPNRSVDLKLTKSAAPAEDPSVAIQAELKRASALQSASQFAEARTIYEALLAKHPDLVQLHGPIAGTYVGEKNFDKAIEHMKLATDAQPENADLKIMLADLLTEKGDRAAAQAIVDAVDITKVTDPTVIINLAIGSINAGKPDEAVAALDKVATQFPTRADVLYYRGRANLTAKKYVEAKADLEKFVAMAPPEAPQVADAKKLLEQIKDVK